MVDGTVFAGGCPGERHHHFEQIAKAAEVDVAARWTAPIAVFDKMKRPALITLLREQVGDASADNCSTIKKKADLAVNVSERLPANWLPAPMIVGAFDQIEKDDRTEADQMEAEAEVDEMA
jgi:ParB family chromosome partitioning protein